jgi:ssDNA-binding Zn-finger/Zn-ribbon topoisomerase 1
MSNTVAEEYKRLIAERDRAVARKQARAIAKLKAIAAKFEERFIGDECTNCDGRLVIRWNTADFTEGNAEQITAFGGCSNYPKCRYTERLRGEWSQRAKDIRAREVAKGKDAEWPFNLMWDAVQEQNPLTEVYER